MFQEQDCVLGMFGIFLAVAGPTFFRPSGLQQDAFLVLLVNIR
jgi:hypothetical protein